VDKKNFGTEKEGFRKAFCSLWTSSKEKLEGALQKTVRIVREVGKRTDYSVDRKASVMETWS